MNYSRALLLLLLLLTSGCGRGYSLIGRVIVIASGGVKDPGIHEVTGHAVPSYGTPVAGATVTLFHQLDRNGAPVRASVWQKDVKTNEKGEFRLFDYATPGRKNLVGLEVKADGYSSTYTTYWDYQDPDYQYFFVVLRPAA